MDFYWLPSIFLLQLVYVKMKFHFVQNSEQQHSYSILLLFLFFMYTKLWNVVKIQIQWLKQSNEYWIAMWITCACRVAYRTISIFSSQHTNVRYWSLGLIRLPLDSLLLLYTLLCLIVDKCQLNTRFNGEWNLRDFLCRFYVCVCECASELIIYPANNANITIQLNFLVLFFLVLPLTHTHHLHVLYCFSICSFLLHFSFHVRFLSSDFLSHRRRAFNKT